MTSKEKLLKNVDDELTQFVQDNAAALQDRDFSVPSILAKMQRFRAMLSLLPMENEKADAMLELDSCNILRSILEFYNEISRRNTRFKDYAICVERFVDEAYRKYRLTALKKRIEKNSEDYKAEIAKLPPRQIMEHAVDISARDDIISNFNSITDTLGSKAIKVLLTLDNPLLTIYQQWIKQEECDMRYLDEIIAAVVCDCESQVRQMEVADEELENHVPSSNTVLMLKYMSRLNKLWEVVDREYSAFFCEEKDSKILAKLSRIYTMLNLFPSTNLMLVEAFLTFDNPMEAILCASNQFDDDKDVLSAAFEYVPSLRLKELMDYWRMIDKLPNFMQGPLHVFGLRFKEIQTLYAQVQAGRTEQGETNGTI